MIWLLLPLTALAQDPDFAGTDEEGQVFEESETTLSAELGGAYTTGNTEFYNVNGTIDFGRKWEQNKLSLVGSVLIGEGRIDADGNGTLDDTERAAERIDTAQKITGDLRYDRFVGESASLYVLVGGLKDKFSGFDLRTHEQFGYSRLLVDTKPTTLRVELGVDYAQENYVEGIDPNTRNIIAGRALVGFKHAFNDSVSFSETAEVFENVLDPVDLRINNTAALNSKLSDKFSLKLSHELRFDNQPVAGDTFTFRKMDQTTMVTVVASLL